jgi:N-acetylmuramoyl-L-alanine amidase CwlA
MLNIKNMQIKNNYSPASIIKPKYIVIHETANVSIGANAVANRNFFNKAGSNASAHYIIDDSNIIQCLRNDQRAWHVGDNAKHSDITNDNAIGIELCVNAGNSFDKTIRDCVELVKKLMIDLSIPIYNVKRHFDASGKWCPATILNKTGMWERFISDCTPKIIEKEAIVMAKSDCKLSVNGSIKQIEMKTEAGHNFISVADLTKIIDCQIGFDNATKTINITTKK